MWNSNYYITITYVEMKKKNENYYYYHKNLFISAAFANITFTLRHILLYFILLGIEYNNFDDAHLKNVRSSWICICVCFSNSD